MFRRNIVLPIGNSESDSIGQFVFPAGLETDCRRETGASRLSPTQLWVKTLRRKVAYLLNQTKTTNLMPFAVYSVIIQ
ncbi:MAG: hypothetical protein LBG58_05550 [Planctomycetaceae bacterium]|jgi:hypothetical protein|nr:hypothetical protein [Planctomycetaceae bacterium]